MLTAPLEAKALRVRRGGRTVLHEVSVAIGDSEILAVVGPNGAGKSTFLLACLGLLAFDGEVRLAGRPLASYAPRERARRLAFVPQADARPIPFTAGELVRLGRYPYRAGLRAPGPADDDIAAEAMALTGTSAFADRRVSSLSGGERQRVQVAAALAQRPAVLLLDEPTAFLDPRHQVEIAALLRRLHREQGVAVVFVTHDLNLAAACAHRVLALREGHITYLGDTGGLLDTAALARLYDADFDVTVGVDGTRRAFPRVPS